MVLTVPQRQGQDQGAFLSLNDKNEISKYAEQFLKSKMDTEMQMGASFEASNLHNVMDGSHDIDYEQSFKMLLKLIDSALDEFKVELQQLVFPYFTILYLTMIRRGFDSKATEFMDTFKHLIFHPDLPMLQSIKTSHDLVSSLNADKYLLNKF